MTLFPTMIKVALYSDWDHPTRKKIQKKAKKILKKIQNIPLLAKKLVEFQPL